MTVLVTVSSFLFGAVVVLPLMLMLVCMPFMCVSFLDYKTSNQYHRIISYDRKCIGYLAFFSSFGNFWATRPVGHRSPWPSVIVVMNWPSRHHTDVLLNI